MATQIVCDKSGLFDAYIKAQHGLTHEQFDALPLADRYSVVRMWQHKIGLTAATETTPWMTAGTDGQDYDRATFAERHRADRALTIGAYALMTFAVIGLIIALALAAPSFWHGRVR